MGVADAIVRDDGSGKTIAFAFTVLRLFKATRRVIPIVRRAITLIALLDHIARCIVLPLLGEQIISRMTTLRSVPRTTGLPRHIRNDWSTCPAFAAPRDADHHVPCRLQQHRHEQLEPGEIQRNQKSPGSERA
ncbi:hypothetical protein [Burkholderia cepacia]|uniref:hypothetical protein n=1 Tax=Burkholderia cepacia TaxID=292 RepID=UPI00163A0BCB|nr:hypothetical protein [Burkholderia cepacia]